MSGLNCSLAAWSQASPWIFAIGATVVMGLTGLVIGAIVDGIFKVMGTMLSGTEQP